jgi:hypothetical protein
MVGLKARPIGAVVTAVVFMMAGGRLARAQELEPRAYSLSPVGANFFVALVGNLSGAILFDPTVPITDARGDIDTLTLGYGRTFGLAGRLATVSIAVPCAVGNFEGMVLEASQSVRRRGFGDTRVKASWILLGGKAMTPAEFAAAPRKTMLGASLTVQAPTGQYEPSRLINLGTNRWAFKPELGVAVPVKAWSLEAYLGAWFFTDNDAFYPGASVKRQDPLASLQAHVSYTFKNRAWLAFDGTWYGGGESTVDANPPSSRMSNSRIGGTFSIPVAARQSAKAAARTGA